MCCTKCNWKENQTFLSPSMLYLFLIKKFKHSDRIYLKIKRNNLDIPKLFSYMDINNLSFSANIFCIYLIIFFFLLFLFYYILLLYTSATILICCVKQNLIEINLLSVCLFLMAVDENHSSYRNSQQTLLTQKKKTPKALSCEEKELSYILGISKFPTY